MKKPPPDEPESGLRFFTYEGIIAQKIALVNCKFGECKFHSKIAKPLGANFTVKLQVPLIFTKVLISS